jgi:LCP family protein required for cell wall assembly
MNSELSISRGGGGLSNSRATTRPVRRLLPHFWIALAAIPVLTITLLLGVLISSLNQPITLLLLGSDGRSSSGPSRSDSIFVLRADPRQGTIRGLSLPRDLYVPLKGLPVRRTAKLNAALYYGDYYGQTEGIPAARETVSDLIGVPVDGTVVVHFGLLDKLVDSIGGVEIYFENPVADPHFFTMTGDKSYRLRFEAGWNYLNGQKALDYVRMRKPDTDFGRMKRNRQLLSVIMTRLKSPASWLGLPRLIPQLPSEIDTDTGLGSWLHIAWAFGRCAANGIVWDSIDKKDLLPGKLPTGSQVLLPEPGVLKEAGETLVGSQPLHLADAGLGLSDTVSR